MSFYVGWPQAVWFLLIVVTLVRHIVMNGMRREEKYDAKSFLIGALIEGLLLYWGGFFLPHFEDVLCK
ncbi:MAG: hypothetical protein LUC93_03615 [Planctomycetaceae bacterium]|nr:hypothetical protein [Planctomycetaceae bacterium]